MGNFNHLPTDILLDIITRLPTESILDCKLVCQPWRNLVSYHPSFSQMHLTHLNQSADSGKLSFLIIAKQQLHYFEYNEKNDDQTPLYSARRIKLTPPFTYRYKIIGSCSGLVCLYGDKDLTYCICNPITREYVLLQKIKADCDDHYNDCVSGFGYLPSTNEYKVVELCQLKGGSSFTEVAVYTLGSGNGWENVKRLAFRIYAGDGVFVNGVLHWVGIGGMVWTFDLNEEMFECLAQPPLPQVGWHDRTLAIGVTTVGISYYSAGYCCHITESRCFDIWLSVERDPLGWSKKSYLSEPQGWSKKCSLPERQPLAFTKNGGVLCFGDSSFGIYDVIASTWERLMDISAVTQISPHKNTLVSLKELGEEDI